MIVVAITAVLVLVLAAVVVVLAHELHREHTDQTRLARTLSRGGDPSCD